MTIAIFILLIIFLIIDFRYDKKLFSPVKIFNVIWLLVFGLYQLKLSELQTDFTQTALWAFIACIASFNLTYIIRKYLGKKSKRKSTKNEIFSWYQPKIPLQKKLRFINIAFIILFIVEIIYTGSLPLVSLLMGEDSDYLNFGISSLNGLLYGVAICMGAYYIYKKDVRALIYLSFGALIMSRQLLVAIIVEAAIVLLCDRGLRQRGIKHLAIKVCAVIAAVLVGFNIMGNFRSGGDTMQNIFQAREGYENLPTFVMWPYSYSEFSLSNFNKLTTKTDGGVNHGASTLNAILPTVLTNKIKIEKNFNEYYLIKPNFTVSTWFPEIYLDFGIIGIVIFFALVSLLSYKLYMDVLRKKTAENLLLYALLAHNIIFFFFVNMFFYLPVISQIILIPIIFRESRHEIPAKNN